MIALPSAARTMRFAFVAMRLWCEMSSSAMVSMNCAWIAGPRTTTMGSYGNTGVPSGTAQTSQANLKWRR